MAETRQFKKRAASQPTFQNLQPIIPVNEKKFAVLHVEDVVAVDGVLSLATGAIKNVTALF